MQTPMGSTLRHVLKGLRMVQKMRRGLYCLSCVTLLYTYLGYQASRYRYMEGLYLGVSQG